MRKSAAKKPLYNEVRLIIEQAREHVVRNINTTMLVAYFEIGRMIIENTQAGKERAGYAEETLTSLSSDLTREFGKGYSRSNLEYMISFYKTYRNRLKPISQSLIGKSKNTGAGVISQSLIGKFKNTNSFAL